MAADNQRDAAVSSNERVLALIVEEIDDARDTYEIVRQLHAALPLNNFDDLKRALGERGMLKLKGAEHPVEPFRNIVPRVIFPIQDVESLVQLTKNFIKLVPAGARSNLTDPANVRREMQRNLIFGFSNNSNVPGAPRPGWAVASSTQG